MRCLHTSHISLSLIHSLGGARDRTSNLPITSQLTALPPELRGPDISLILVYFTWVCCFTGTFTDFVPNFLPNTVCLVRKKSNPHRRFLKNTQRERVSPDTGRNMVFRLSSHEGNPSCAPLLQDRTRLQRNLFFFFFPSPGLRIITVC